MTLQDSVARLVDSQRHVLGNVLSAAFLQEPNFTYMLPRSHAPAHRTCVVFQQGCCGYWPPLW